MNNTKQIFSLILILLICFSTACKQKDDEQKIYTPGSDAPSSVTEPVEEKSTPTQTEKGYISIEETFVEIPQEELLKKAEIILKGRVASKDSEFMTNPDGTRTNENGDVVTNCQVATYTVEIDQLYKGDYSADTITVKTANGHGLSPDLILYGEDETHILADELNRFDLEVGKECILLLSAYDESLDDLDGYYAVFGNFGYFLPDENGGYTNNTPTNIVTLSPDTLTQDIATAMQPE